MTYIRIVQVRLVTIVLNKRTLYKKITTLFEVVIKETMPI